MTEPVEVTQADRTSWMALIAFLALLIAAWPVLAMVGVLSRAAGGSR